MKILFSQDGTFTVEHQNRQIISRSPLCVLINQGTMVAPLSLRQNGNILSLIFPQGECVLEMQEGEWLHLTVKSVPQGTEQFMFGPYIVKDAVNCGELVGCAWLEDGSAVCIQSLNPKTVAEGACVLRNDTEFPTPGQLAAMPCDKDSINWDSQGRNIAKMPCGPVMLQCHVNDMSSPRYKASSARSDFESSVVVGMENAYILPVEGEDAEIAGGSIALCFASDRQALLETIGKIEIAYDLPHPMIDGKWAKTSKATSEIFFVIDGNEDDKAKIDIAERAGVHCVYFSNPFYSWGHFEINRALYPTGFDGFRDFVAYAKKHGVNTGFHTLSNFIHTHDAYVTPVPHKDLLVIYDTPLTADIGENDTDIFVADEHAFAINNTLNACRINDEIICYTSFEKETKCLKNCTRGAFGTQRFSHKKGDLLQRLADHGYRTLFPSIKLQGEMAENIGNLIKAADIRRISFDGMEGCLYTGQGEYACSEYVRKVFSITGNNLLCDASTSSHYRWHAHSYFNWGEPWYEDNRLGGSFNYRANNQLYFERNLLPKMIGWYAIWSNDPNDKADKSHLEVTMPEILETILARTVGFDAGCCFCLKNVNGFNGRLNEYLDSIKLWSEFHRENIVCEKVRALMRDESTYWHLEKSDGAWLLRKWNILESRLNDHESLEMESGTNAYALTQKQINNAVMHSSMINLDRSSGTIDAMPQSEPLYFRMRVGYRHQSGALDGLSLNLGWGGAPVISFPCHAEPGDYLEYHGGTVLKRYNSNLQFIEEYQGNGKEYVTSGACFTGVTFEYYTGKDDDLDISVKAFQTERLFQYPIQK